VNAVHKSNRFVGSFYFLVGVDQGISMKLDQVIQRSPDDFVTEIALFHFAARPYFRQSWP
jgi:hypothetical protein